MMATTIERTPGRVAARGELDARARPAAVAAWLFLVAGLILAMVVVGGVTRLTESGLSITRWEPVRGIVPPLGQADWLAEFARYKATSQYRLMNAGMGLAAFQGIYWWEWAHRLLGRVIGLAFALPLAWFAVRRALPRGLWGRLLLLLGLGGLQGAIGWWMVSSGLVNRTEVAHERLAVHLLMALTLFAAVLWTALDVRPTRWSLAQRLPRAGAVSRAAMSTRWIVPMFALLAAQIGLGAFTAGLRAGHAADTWPLMAGRLVPDLPAVAAWWSDPVTVHFLHRTLAYAVATAALWLAWTAARAGAGWRAGAVAGAVTAQFALGVATVVSGVALPLAAMHQAGSVALLAALVALAHWARAGGDAASGPARLDMGAAASS